VVSREQDPLALADVTDLFRCAGGSRQVSSVPAGRVTAAKLTQTAVLAANSAVSSALAGDLQNG
jgi:hypothetical protein